MDDISALADRIDAMFKYGGIVIAVIFAMSIFNEKRHNGSVDDGWWWGVAGGALAWWVGYASIIGGAIKAIAGI